jgi:muramoyltetrapeptide carboxypeptidase LdcA involved in peptidoglycan recycling
MEVLQIFAEEIKIPVFKTDRLGHQKFNDPIICNSPSFIAPSAKKIIDEDNQLYLIDQEQGVFIFDYYGAYNRLIPLKDLRHIDVEKNCLIGFSDTIMEVTQLKNVDSKKYTLPNLSEKIKSLKFVNNKLYILTQTSLNIYRLD